MNERLSTQPLQHLRDAVVVRMMGGLGNQLFQYSAGRALAVERGVTLQLDTSFYQDQQLRSFQLDHFQVAAVILSSEATRALAAWRNQTPRNRCLRRIWPRDVFRKWQYIHEGGIQLCPEVLSLRGPVYLDGYWQSEKYFAHVAPKIKAELTLRDSLSSANEQLAGAIRDCNSVAIHVRRGDYVSDAAVRAVHGTCSLEYYRDAVRSLREQVSDSRFFVFSDDPQWSRTNLDLPGSTMFVEGNLSRRDCDDLWLMSLCNHFVIANSTFSWWSAWLASHPEKIVIAPANWFRRSDMSSADLVPERWQRV